MLNEIYQSLDPVAFQAGPVVVRWYGLAYVLGFALAAFIIYRVSRRWRISVDADSLLTIMICVIVGIILGARLGYCLFYGNGYYLVHPLEILAFNQGGMSFHGGLMGALLSGIVASRITRIPYLTLCDIGVIAASLGLFFGRCANFVNGELWGGPTDLPWGVVFGGAAGDIPRHPSQLYEGVLEGLVIFAVLYTLSLKVPPRPRGTFTGVFLLMYGTFRFAVEFVREPDVQLGYLAGGWLTMGMVLSLPLVVAGAALLAYATKRKLPQEGSPAAGGGLQESDAAANEGAGPRGKEDEVKEDTEMEVKFYKCMHCGNIAIKVFDSGVPLVCCGEPMVELVADTQDASLEKHVPAVTIEGNRVHVNVGSVDHPMEEQHYIQFICLVKQDSYDIHPLKPGDAPHCDFFLGEGEKPVAVYEFCNIHGLWKTEL